MAALGELPRALGVGSKVFDGGISAGPASYLVGGFTITSEIASADVFGVIPQDARLLATSNFFYVLKALFTTRTITVTVYSMNALAGGAFAETANSGNFSALNFNWFAIGN